MKNSIDICLNKGKHRNGKEKNFALTKRWTLVVAGFERQSNRLFDKTNFFFFAMFNSCHFYHTRLLLDISWLTLNNGINSWYSLFHRDISTNSKSQTIENECMCYLSLTVSQGKSYMKNVNTFRDFSRMTPFWVEHFGPLKLKSAKATRFILRNIAQWAQFTAEHEHFNLK